jgi:hypothetical protein
MKRKLIIFMLVFGAWSGGWLALPQETRGQGPVIATGELRRQISATPIVARPNRPLHVYGNAVRRRHHRGVSAPTGRQVVRASRAVTRRR